MAKNDFGFDAAMKRKGGGEILPAGKLDLSGFDTDKSAAVDHQAAEQALITARAKGFSEREPTGGTGARHVTPPTRRRLSRVKVSEVGPRKGRNDEDRAQLNILAPVSIVAKYREFEKRFGGYSWEALAALLEAAEAGLVTTKK